MNYTKQNNENQNPPQAMNLPPRSFGQLEPLVRRGELQFKMTPFVFDTD